MRILLIDLPPFLAEGVSAGLTGHVVITTTQDVLDESIGEDVANADMIIQGYPRDGADHDRIDRATRGTWNVLTTPGVRRYLQVSTLELFEAYDPDWAIDETWLPAPSSDPRTLVAYLAELTGREIGRSRGIDIRVLRLDQIIQADTFSAGPVQPDWLHVDDAIASLLALAQSLLESTEHRPHWDVVHAARGLGRYPCTKLTRTLGIVPAHPGPSSPAGPTPDLPTAPLPITELPTPQTVTIYGAGGPLGAVVANELAATGTRLCLTDRRALTELAAAPPQSASAPKPRPPVPPHREMLVDVTNPEQVENAARGSDCLINCTVVRADVRGAFAVNVLGAYTIMRAAIQHGIRRVVHTGPAQVLHDYNQDRLLASSTPARPGDRLYFLTKLLGQEICRIIAEEHQIATPVLLFVALTEPDRAQQVRPFMITWHDAGRAVTAAARVGHLTEPSPVINVKAPSPHGRYRDGETDLLLGWSPKDRLDRLWTRAHTHYDH